MSSRPSDGWLFDCVWLPVNIREEDTSQSWRGHIEISSNFRRERKKKEGTGFCQLFLSQNREKMSGKIVLPDLWIQVENQRLFKRRHILTCEGKWKTKFINREKTFLT